MSNLVKKIQNTVFQQELLKKGDKIILAVSGGPDSVCLLDIFARLAPKYNLQLRIAHVNYGLRGADSERDEKLVRQLAEKYKMKIETLTPSPEGRGGGAMPSENELRDIRYAFFEKVRQKNKFDLVAVAHNSEDQVETFLMRVIRGAGLKGLSAMQYKSGKLIRPLLGTTRAEILNYSKSQYLVYRTDKTNKADLFFRNKVRNKLIPYLEKNFNPKIKKTIFAAVSSIAEDYSLIQELSDNISGGKQALSVKKILKLHPALQRRVLLKIISEKKPGVKDVEAAHIEEITKALKSTKNKNQIVIFKGLKMTRKGDKVIIEKLTR
ncbi:MAG: tRNA lysidine(34) synthetase TilS [Patescibacteria group bacterium]